jgi:hypothetical protein
MVLLLSMLMACGSGTIGSSDDDDDGGSEVTDDTGTPTDDALCINELMPDNQGSLIEDDETPDWLELYNAEFQTISLVGWTLQVDGGTLVPLDALEELEATEPLLLLADGVDDVGDGHLPVSLDADGGTVVLTGPNGTGERINYGLVQPNHSVARETDCCAGSECLVYDYAGTPGEENGE